MEGKSTIFIRRGLWIAAGTAVALWSAATAVGAAPIVIPQQGTFVVDRANVINDETKSQLERMLKDLEQKTTAQVKILTLDSTGDEDIFTFAQRQYSLWQLGTKEKSNGALIVLAVSDRKIRIHTGRGLEGPLPDSWIGTLSRAVSQQYFKAGQYSEGIDELAKSVAVRVAEDAGVTLDENPQPQIQPVAESGEISAGVILVILLIVIVIIFVRRGDTGRRRHRGAWGGPVVGGWGGGFGGSSWGGGGFSGGFGGGGSFGGGSFGGGGSSAGGGGRGKLVAKSANAA